MNTETNWDPARPKFKGWMVKVTRNDGEPFIAWVVNRGIGKPIGNAPGSPLLKVRPRFVQGYRGWSGGAYPQYGYGEPIWVLASRVIAEWEKRD